MSNIAENFRASIVQAGFNAPEKLTPDGVIHHFAVGRSDAPSHFYLLKSNGYGVVCNIKNGVRFEWRAGS